MNRTMVAAAVLAASLTTGPVLAQGALDPATDAVPSPALPPAAGVDTTPAPAPEALPGLPQGDAPLPDTLPAPGWVPPSGAVPNPAPAVPAPGAVPAPAPFTPAPAPPAVQVFTDIDVTNFARALLAIEPLRTDATLDETQRQAKMRDALTGAGIAVETFNSIAVQSQTDAALKTRIQTQVAALQAAQPPAA